MKIIQSICDQDLYKMSMSYFYMTKFPQAEGEFIFTDRNNEVYDEDFLREVKLAIADMASLKLTREEKEKAFQLTGEWIPLHFWEWLEGFRYEPEKVNVWLDEEKHLHITVEDLLYKVTLWEVPLLAIISEIRGKWKGYTYNMEDVLKRVEDQIKLSNQEQLYFSEFGTRRRFSYIVQEEVCKLLAEKATYYSGTSNVYLAIMTGVKAIGTLAHELVACHCAFYGYRMGNYMTMSNWADVYDGSLGIMLTDELTDKVFFKNFSRRFAKLYDGVRCDSQDEFSYTSMAVNRYKELGIDPTTKTIVFSNSIDIPKLKEIRDNALGRIKAVGGIGGALTNRIPIPENKSKCYPSANIVMKLWKVRMNKRQEWINTIKLSDDPRKAIGDRKEIELAKLTLGIE